MKITLYTINDCQFCKTEKDYLTSKNLPFEEKNLETNREFLTEMLAVSNNFAGTPVTKIEKDDGQIVILKGFTKEEFDKTLGFESVATEVTQPAPAAVIETPTVPMQSTMPAPVMPVSEPMVQAPVAPAPVTPVAEPVVQEIKMDSYMNPPAAAPAPVVETAPVTMEVPMPGTTQPTMPAPMPTEPMMNVPDMSTPQAPVAPTVMPQEPAVSMPDSALNNVLNNLQAAQTNTDTTGSTNPPQTPPTA